MKGRTGENLLVLLERRLDNVVFRLGFATSRAEARQLVRHGHFHGERPQGDDPVDARCSAGDVVMLREGSREIARIAAALEALEGKQRPAAGSRSTRANFAGVGEGSCRSREDVTMPIQEQLIVELYSR